MNEQEIALKVAQKLLEIEAIKLSPQNPFTWASGLKSPIYCDNRMILSFPEIRNHIITAFVKLSKKFGTFDYVAGVATAGIPHAALIADRLAVPMIYVRSKAKAHGRQNLIEGFLQPNSKILVIEDLISTGKSSINAVNALKKEGAEVVGVMAIFNYGFEATKKAFNDIGCPYETLSNYTALIQTAKHNGSLSQEQMDNLSNWSEDPQRWSEANS